MSKRPHKTVPYHKIYANTRMKDKDVADELRRYLNCETRGLDSLAFSDVIDIDVVANPASQRHYRTKLSRSKNPQDAFLKYPIFIEIYGDPDIEVQAHLAAVEAVARFLQDRMLDYVCETDDEGLLPNWIRTGCR